MKSTSSREQDLNDVAEIVKHENLQDPIELLQKLIKIEFDIDISILLDVFGTAYGIDWLENYYKENESEISKYS